MRVEMMERAVAQGSSSDPEGKTKKMTKKAAAMRRRRRKGAARDEVRDEVKVEVRDEVVVVEAVKVAEGMKIQQLRAVMADEVKEVKENATRRRRRRRDAGKLHSSSGSSEQERGPAPAAATTAAPGTGDASLRWEGALPDPAAEEERMRLYRLRRRERYLTARRDLCRRLNLPPALAEPDRDSPPAAAPRVGRPLRPHRGRVLWPAAPAAEKSAGRGGGRRAGAVAPSPGGAARRAHRRVAARRRGGRPRRRVSACCAKRPEGPQRFLVRTVVRGPVSWARGQLCTPIS
ncbi:protein LIAT1 [Lethenteron reissneri]|uniref:protein LIAT1 n=1 Tax=Lethenteron reissneri TaxID=7753 RepID=UPI002AB6620A|nr:protein LIAT1 [Lethenteron reissneri]